MKVSLIILVSLCAFAASSDVIKSHYSPEYLRELWEAWKEEQEWDCGTESQEECLAEEEKRFNIFLENLQEVEICNQDPNVSHTCALGRFAHLTLEEFLEQYTGVVHPDDNVSGDRLLSEAPRDLSTSASCTEIDWEALGKVTPVKDQGSCGSCWAFSTTGVIESCQAIVDCTSPVSLSEQQLIECTTPTEYGDYACGGGWPWETLIYAYNSGMMSEEAYPYTSAGKQVGTCEYDSSEVIQQTIGYRFDFSYMDEDYLKQNLCNQPISVLVDATSLKNYKSGVISTCSFTGTDHAVLAVGFNNTENSIKVKNSWGTGWGEEGYFRVSQDDNTGQGYGQCGIYQSPAYPVCEESSNSKC